METKVFISDSFGVPLNPGDPTHRSSSSEARKDAAALDVKTNVALIYLKK